MQSLRRVYIRSGRSAYYRSARNACILFFNHRHRTLYYTSARQTEPFKQIHTVERFGSVSLPPKPVFNFIVSDNRTHVYIMYVSNNIFKYIYIILIVIHIIIMYLYVLCVSVCVYNTRFVNPISINIVFILLWDNLQCRQIYTVCTMQRSSFYNMYCGESIAGR